jgi:dimethylargininase
VVVADNAQGRQLVQAAQACGALGTLRTLWVPDMLCANVLRVRRAVVMQAGYPNSEAVLRPFCEQQGLELHTLPMLEFAKVDGALTCCSILLRA